MSNDEMKLKILELIEQMYKKKYVGKLKVWLDVAWNVRLGMNNVERPIFISAELPDLKFLKYFKHELQSRHLDMVKYFTGFKTSPSKEFCNKCC